jgi:hypothetical protein
LPRHDAGTLQPPRFPILTLDERELAPALGYVFDLKWLLPGESIVSILWKFARANGLAGHVLVHQIGPDVDPYEGVEPVRGVIDVKRLRRMLRLPVNVLRASLLDATLRGRHHKAFRYCRQCAARGYHSVLYQLESEYRCPAHHCALETRCLHCGRETPYILNASLIEAPYRCPECRSPCSYWSMPLLSGRMRKQDRIAISRRFFLRTISGIGKHS